MSGPRSFSLTPGSGQGPFRRPSYATVAAGAVGDSRGHYARAGSLQQQQQQQQQQRGDSPPQAAMAHARQSSRGGMEIDGRGFGGAARPPSGAWTAGEDVLGIALQETHPPFFVPSYLRQSRYMQRLQQTHEAQVAEFREQARLHPPKQPSLSTQSSHASLNKMYTAQLHRPAVQDVIERLPPSTDDDEPRPLPSRWSWGDDDKMSGLEILADGSEVRFAGGSMGQDEAASIRANHPMPRECGLYYFEVTILTKGKDVEIGIGFSVKGGSLRRLPGWEKDSWAYHSDDGNCFAGTSTGKSYGPASFSQDVVGCGLNFKTGHAFFTKNGMHLGTAFPSVKTDQKLYPTVGLKKPGEHLRINFGKQPFIFDIDGMMEQERRAVMADIRKTNVSALHHPDAEDTLIHKLISQYLAHEGYVETAKEFARDVHNKQQSISSSPQPFQLPDSDDDIHAINRQKIRKSILDGDIDRALKYSSSYYPHVLEEERNKDIYFRLKCRKFIEMMRRCTEMVTAASPPSMVTKSGTVPSHNGHVDAATRTLEEAARGDVVQDTQMELDDQLHREASKGLGPSPTDDVDMDASQEFAPKTPFMKKDDLLDAALSYGQELQHEFGSDPRQQVQKELRDLFAIIAYSNPADSPIGGLLDQRGRVQIAEDVNGAILVSLGKPSSAALEKVCAQTEALLDETAAKSGGAAAFINVRKDFLQP